MPKTKRFEATLYSPEWLRRVYVDENRNAAQVAALISCDKSAVLGALRRHGIPVKDASEAQKLAPHPGSHAPRPRAAFKDTLHNPEWLEARKHLNASEIAREAGCSVPSAREAMTKAGFTLLGISEAKAGRPAPYKHKPEGSQIGRATSHRRANKNCPKGPCVVCDGEGEHVNHIDRNWQNNLPENLERLCSPCHKMQHGVETFVMIEVLEALGVSYREIWDKARAKILTQGFSHRGRIPGRITIGDETHTLSQWALIVGMNEGTFRRRLASGMDPEEALRVPIRKHHKVEFQGVVASLADHARRVGIPVGNVYSRVAQGWPFEKALSVPIRQVD